MVLSRFFFGWYGVKISESYHVNNLGENY
jgi:hypothetical protein